MSELQKFPNSFITEQFVKYVEEKEIEAITDTLAHVINEKYKDQELIIIGILKGSVLFISDLIKKLKDVKVYVDFIRVGSVARTKESEGTITILKDITTNIYDRNVLIVQEIVDTGRALNFVKSRLLLSQPKSVEVLTLFDKPYKRVTPVKVQYVGKQIEDQFIIGYGLDLDQYGRNFKDLYYLKYPN